MRVLKKRGTTWWLDRFKILNANEVDSLDHVQLDYDDSGYREWDNDLQMLVFDSADEMIKALFGAYALMIRFYDNFKEQEPVFWSNIDARLKSLPTRRLGYHLGVWHGDWKPIHTELKLHYDRTIIIRPEWMDPVVEQLERAGKPILPPF